MSERIGKEHMLADWERVLIAMFRAQSGDFNVSHVKNDDGEVIGVTGELMLGFEEALSVNFVKDFNKAVEIARKEAEAAINDKKEITSKQKMMINWFEIRNSIVRAETGEMKVSHHNNKVPGGGIVGVTVEWALDFDGPTSISPTDEEKDLIDKAHQE
jgi:hypothetical protein